MSRKAFVMMFVLAGLAGCASSYTGTETAKELCITWAEGLFLPSRQDTEETAVKLNAQLQDFETACNRFGVRRINY